MTKSTTMRDGFLAIGAMVFFTLAGMFAGRAVGDKQIELLQQQLKQTQQQLQLQSGKPINIADLPDGNWSILRNNDYAFVQKDGGNPFEPTIVAVHSCNEIPQHFSVADVRQQIAEFLSKNPLPPKK